MIVISGPGRSGTSFLAALYRELGFDPGGGWRDDIRAGLEAADVVEINSMLCAEINAPVGPPPRPPLGQQQWHRVGELADKHGKQLRALAKGRDVAKDPRFAWTLRIWLEAGAEINHVVMTMRKVEDVIGSAEYAGMRKHPASTEGLNGSRSVVIYRMGSLLATVGDYDVPHTVLWFPRYLADAEALYRQLVFPKHVDRDTFIEVFERTVNPDFVHFGTEGSASRPTR
ncbi:MAG: hypothetical protein WD826_11395 [Actinomycetota bacterium]